MSKTERIQYLQSEISILEAKIGRFISARSQMKTMSKDLLDNMNPYSKKELLANGFSLDTIGEETVRLLEESLLRHKQELQDLERG